VGLGNAVKFAHVALSLVPEILDAIDVAVPVREQFRMVDPVMFEGRDIQYVVRAEGVGIDDAVRHDFVLQDGFQGLAFYIWNDFRIDLATPLQRPNTGTFPAAPRPRLPLRLPPK